MPAQVELQMGMEAMNLKLDELLNEQGLLAIDSRFFSCRNFYKFSNAFRFKYFVQGRVSRSGFLVSESNSVPGSRQYLRRLQLRACQVSPWSPSAHVNIVRSARKFVEA